MRLLLSLQTSRHSRRFPFLCLVVGRLRLLLPPLIHSVICKSFVIALHWYSIKPNPSSPPRDALILRPFYEYLTTNASFPLVSIRTIPYSSAGDPTWLKSSPQTVALPHAVLSLASYILTHATASGSSRAASYAQLALAIIQTWIRDPYVVKTFMMQQGNVWLCRQVQLLINICHLVLT